MSADDPYGSPSSGALSWALRQLAIWGGLTLVLYAVVGNRTWFEPARPVEPPRAEPKPLDSREDRLAAWEEQLRRREEELRRREQGDDPTPS